MKNFITDQKIKSLKDKITPEFIDYCNLNNIDLVKWYKWQLHIIWQQRKIVTDLNPVFF